MNRKIFLGSIILIIVDQVSKALITCFLGLHESVTIINNFFYLTYYNNTGAAWGILENYHWILIVISLLALVIVYRFMYSFKMNKRNIIAFSLLIGGIIGNLIDRLFLGSVRDFLDFYFFNYNYPIFNIADMAVVIGSILLIIAIFKGEEHEKRRKN